jgi:hypothetical protein
MALRNYCSTVDPTKTAGEIQQLLARYGARRVALDYDEDGQCEAITFMADVGGQDLYFRLEPDPSGTLQALKNDPSSYWGSLHNQVCLFGPYFKFAPRNSGLKRN